VADRDWDKELAKVDRQLKSLSDDQLVSPGVASAPPAPVKSGRTAAPAAAAGEPSPRGGVWAVYGRLTISVALGLAMLVWPYPARCGAGLAAYLAAVVVVVGSGVWSAVWSWRHRASRAHTLSLLLVLWGLVLGSVEVLPRVGYAVPTLQHPAVWSCP
jgi:hypothetical protein